MNKENDYPAIILAVVLFFAVLIFSGTRKKKETITQLKSKPEPATKNVEVTAEPIKNTSENDDIVFDAKLINVTPKTKCIEDGQVFVQNFRETNDVPNSLGYKPVWQGPQFHYNTRMDTCLVYISFYQQKTKVTPSEASSSDQTNETVNWSIIFDIYSKKAVMQNGYSKYITDGKVTEKTYDEGLYSNIPNSDMTTFRERFIDLMNL